MIRPALVLAGVLALVCAACAPRQPAAGPPPGEWSTFEGEWSASADRRTIPTETDRPAAIVHFSGAVSLVVGEGLSGGFRAEAVGFDDGLNLTVGRAVWTDERGDQIFSELRGGPVETGRTVAGTIMGGTGRYAGLSGEYEFTWQYVVHGEDNAIQGRTAGLKGRFRRGGGRP